jgi:hypothetical protein
MKFNPTLGGLHSGEILMLPLGGLNAKHAVQLGIWVPTQPLIWDQGKRQQL